MKIWKAVLEPRNVQAVQMPRGAKILSVQAQSNRAILWYLCDSEAPMEDRTIVRVVTGDAPPEGVLFIGTVQLDGGNFVVHIFERPL